MFRRRWKSGPSGKSRLRRNLLIAALAAVLLLLQSYWYIERNLKQPLTNLAKVRVRQLATESINAAISERLAETANFDKLIDWKMGGGGKISGFMLNYAEHMKVTAAAARLVQDQLNKLTAMPEQIPLGQAMNSPILASFGPDVPVRLIPAGLAKVDLDTRYHNAGINMILVEVYIHISVEMTVIVPFDAVPEIVETELPVSYSLVVGDVPTYYFDGKGNPVGQSNPLPPGVTLPSFNVNQPAQGATALPTGKDNAAAPGNAADEAGAGSARRQ